MFQKSFQLAAVNSESCGGELGKGFRSGVLIDKAILHGRLQAYVEPIDEGFIILLHEPLDGAKVGQVGCHGGGTPCPREVKDWIDEGGVMKVLKALVENLVSDSSI